VGCNACACTIADSPAYFIVRAGQVVARTIELASSDFLHRDSILDYSTASALSRADTLPVRTPAPPGGWISTPGFLRRKNLLKVRFDNMTSDSAISDTNTGAKDGEVEVLPVADWDTGSSPWVVHGSEPRWSRSRWSNYEFAYRDY
jgi:hypothetical protein